MGSLSRSIGSKFTNAKVTFISTCIVTDTVRSRIEHHIVLLVGQLCSKENIYLIAHKVKQAKYGQTACREMCEERSLYSTVHYHHTTFSHRPLTWQLLINAFALPSISHLNKLFSAKPCGFRGATFNSISPKWNIFVYATKHPWCQFIFVRGWLHTTVPDKEACRNTISKIFSYFRSALRYFTSEE